MHSAIDTETVSRAGRHRPQHFSSRHADLVHLGDQGQAGVHALGADGAPSDATAAPKRQRRFTVDCLACGRRVAGTARRKYCSETCRQFAYYWRHGGPVALSAAVATRPHRRTTSNSLPGMTSAQPQLVLGSLVRVRLRQDRPCEDVPHLLGEEDVVGHIVSLTPPASAPRHPYLVMFDRLLVCTLQSGTGFPLSARHYAEDELMLI